MQPAAAPGAPTLRVGRWTVDPALHQLGADGTVLRIEPKAMEVLLCLAEHPGQVVSREALLDRVWRGVVVGDDALTQVVVKLRRALGDERREGAYIQTISKSGYRLVAPVSRTVDAPPPSPRKRSLAAVVAVAAALLLVAAAAWWSAATLAVDDAPQADADAVARAPGAALPTLWVRPFEAVGGDAQEAWLARGIAADLITDLSKVPGLWVIGAAQAPGAAPDGDAASGGRYLLTGTVQRLGERLRVQLHLADAATGRQLWSERHDRTMAELFEIQDQLGPRILQLLPVKVGEAELRRVAQRYTRNLQAYALFQQARAALHVRRRADNEAARELLRRAIELDPAFARAYAGLAMTHVADFRQRWVADTDAALDRAFELARTAHGIDPELPETHWTLAFVHVHRHQHAQAIEILRRALRLHPSYADGYAIMGGIMTSIGRPADGVPLLRKAIRLAPESGYLYLMLLGRAYLFLGDFEQARLNLRESLARNPQFVDAHVYLAVAHAAAGDRQAAGWEVEELRALEPGFSARRWLQTNPTHDESLRARLVAMLAALGL